MWVFIIKAKSQACSVFKKFKSMVENSSRHKLRMLRIDRGSEFLSNEFTSLCEEWWIERHLAALYTPQQNGAVERRNRTFTAKARSLFKSMHVPGRFWGEAVRHAVHLLNRLSTKGAGRAHAG